MGPQVAASTVSELHWSQYGHQATSIWHPYGLIKGPVPFLVVVLGMQMKLIGTILDGTVCLQLNQVSGTKKHVSSFGRNECMSIS